MGAGEGSRGVWERCRRNGVGLSGGDVDHERARVRRAREGGGARARGARVGVGACEAKLIKLR